MILFPAADQEMDMALIYRADLRWRGIEVIEAEGDCRLAQGARRFAISMATAGAWLSSPLTNSVLADSI